LYRFDRGSTTDERSCYLGDRWFDAARVNAVEVSSAAEGLADRPFEEVAPMTIAAEQVRHIAALAQLELTDAEVAAMQRDLGAILEYVEQLKEVDVAAVEPMTHAATLVNPLRDDVVQPPPGPAALANAPARSGDLVAVPRFLE
jgi:aspartyl-tRNA(Asn)/glutamyl-tRNA(Gln) amidotransferase subunit C